MSKKGKKQIPPEIKRRRKLKKYAKRFVFIAAILTGYFWLLPRISPQYAPQVESTKGQIEVIASRLQIQASKILGTTSELTSKITSASSNSDENIPESIVKKVVEDLKTRVATLPHEQVKKVKREFCADVIEEKQTPEP